MLKRCAEVVRQAAKAHGLKVSDADLQAIEARIAVAMRDLERTNPQWSGFTKAERYGAAAEWSGAQIRADAARKATNAREQIMAQIELRAIEEQMAKLRPSAPKPEPLAGKLSVEREQAARDAAREEFYRASQAAWEARTITRDLVPEPFIAVATLAARAVKRALSPGAVKETALERDFAALKMRAAEWRLHIAKLQDRPGGGLPMVSPPERITVPAGLPDSFDLRLATRFASEMPDLQTVLPGSEERILLRDVLAQIDSELQADHQWADLLRAAATCALTGG